MTPFEKSLIEDAFQKCWGLKDSFERLPDESIEILSQMTGIREKYIRENLDEILA